MKPCDLDLHDARIVAVAIDFRKRSIALRIEVYLDALQSKTRVHAEISFSKVERLSQVADLLELANHRAAGNIAYWHPAAGYGTTNIYLAGGIIAVTAKSLKVRINA